LQLTQFGPQCAVSVNWLTQTPPQIAMPGPHEVDMHWPFVHVWPVWHAWPQVPQLFVSVGKLTHAPLQLVVPAGQLDVHWLLAHTWPD
jgi:hypothetical protein